MLENVLARFALLKGPLSGTYLKGLEPITNLIGILTIVIFSFVLVYKGLIGMLGEK
jgi:hypothetical protein